MFKIIVETEQEKQELLQASRLLHYKRHINLRHPGLNTFAHLYCAPELIEVRPIVNTRFYFDLRELTPSLLGDVQEVNGVKEIHNVEIRSFDLVDKKG